MRAVESGCTTGCTNDANSPLPASQDLLALLAQLASLPAEQRAMLAHLLHPPAANNTPTNFDDTLPRGFEQPKGETG